MATADAPSPRRSTLAMTVLLLLGIEPLHPYALRQRIYAWDKDRVVNVGQRNSVYQTVDRLARSGLIEAVTPGGPRDRTVYRTTERGARTGRRWLLDLLAEPLDEYPAFPAALAFLGALPRPTVLEALRERAASVATRLEREDAEVAEGLAAIPGGVDRINLVEYDYLRTMRAAELAWLRGLIEELEQSGPEDGQEPAPK
ncbi:PadR family transcriptional regulator [Streptomyces sp. ICBB 8177]|uniref:PadR family transcriptional regulator n=1 Tax=Streptomyces sp. ICBB 8177 TaxID=563922 RepID=UPI001F541AB6|nr:PadR family transcriptional regulator [Streptomyces sp. ICBB 8177]